MGNICTSLVLYARIVDNTITRVGVPAPLWRCSVRVGAWKGSVLWNPQGTQEGRRLLAQNVTVMRFVPNSTNDKVPSLPTTKHGCVYSTYFYFEFSIYYVTKMSMLNFWKVSWCVDCSWWKRWSKAAPIYSRCWYTTNWIVQLIISRFARWVYLQLLIL